MKVSSTAALNTRRCRRKFVKNAAIVGTTFSLYPTVLFGKANKPKKITIIGAGLAGLTAGHELKHLGHEVIILEARDRVGGKVLTIREPFSEGLHAQAGGTSFWSFRHDIAKEYIKKFNLQIAKPHSDEGLKTINYYQGKVVENIWNTPLVWYKGLNSEEQGKKLSELQEKYINPIVDKYLDKGYPKNTSSLIAEYDKVSVLEVFRKMGASDSAIKLLINKNFDFLGKDPKTISAFYLFATYANFRLLNGPNYQIKGGNDLLAKAFAERLGNHIKLESVVQRFEQTSKKVIVEYKNLKDGQLQTQESDFLIIAIPFSVLGKIEGVSNLSKSKQLAISVQDQLATCPVFIQTKNAFWKENGYSGNIQTDLPISYAWSGSVPEGRNEGLLEVFINSETGIQLAKLNAEERIAFVLDEMEKVLPGIKKQFVRGYSKPWINDPYAMGCFSYFRVGEVSNYYPNFAIPEGRIHFAGSHTAPLELWGYMQGAMQSGKRVANEINDLN